MYACIAHYSLEHVRSLQAKSSAEQTVAAYKVCFTTHLLLGIQKGTLAGKYFANVRW